MCLSKYKQEKTELLRKHETSYKFLCALFEGLALSCDHLKSARALGTPHFGTLTLVSKHDTFSTPLVPSLGCRKTGVRKGCNSLILRLFAFVCVCLRFHELIRVLGPFSESLTSAFVCLCARLIAFVSVGVGRVQPKWVQYSRILPDFSWTLCENDVCGCTLFRCTLPIICVCIHPFFYCNPPFP